MGATVSSPMYRRGDVVLIPFPMSAPSLTRDVKRRPAVVLAVYPHGNGRDYLLALITTKAAPDPLIMALAPGDITGGALSVPASYLRPAYLFTAGETLIERSIGVLRADLVGETARRASLLLTKGEL